MTAILMDTSGNPFVNANNRFLLKPLFIEFAFTNQRDLVMWTLKEQPYKGYPSLYQIYMETGDLTEYRFVKKTFGSFAHWEELCAAPFFKEFIEAWRKELELKVRSDALQNIQRESKTSSKSAFQANKFLIDKGWITDAKERRLGRTSKDEIKRQAMELHLTDKDITADLKRISLAS